MWYSRFNVDIYPPDLRTSQDLCISMQLLSKEQKVLPTKKLNHCCHAAQDKDDADAETQIQAIIIQEKERVSGGI